MLTLTSEDPSGSNLANMSTHVPVEVDIGNHGPIIFTTSHYWSIYKVIMGQYGTPHIRIINEWT